MDIINQLTQPAFWQAFLRHKEEKQHISKKEYQIYTAIYESEHFLKLIQAMENGNWVAPVPVKRVINKQGSNKKRIVYTYEPEVNLALKLICYGLNQYDGMFAPDCYAFRVNRCAGDAVNILKSTNELHNKFCLKVDIKNYFNSIDVELLLKKSVFFREENEKLFSILKELLCKNEALENGRVVEEKRGAMAGTPISPFLANVYLMDLDHEFQDKGVLYFRYSDDLLLFADTEEELMSYRQYLFQRLRENKLEVNSEKVAVYRPGESITFLGFCFENDKVGLSEVTIQKIKAKIKRKAHALRRWGEQKGLAPEMAAKGFIKAMNHKFFEHGEGSEFTWCRWFLPLLTSAEDLHEIDEYMQQYIRYTVTGRHYKGNYRISYEQMKDWGYRSLVHEYYNRKK